MKRFFGLLLVMCLVLGATTTAFAAETSADAEHQISVTSGNATVVYEDDEKALVEYTVEPRGNNYGSAWQNGAGSGSFTVDTTYSGTLGFTFEVESSSSDSWVYLSVVKPNGNEYWNNVYVDTSEQVFKTAYFASSGTYTVNYTGFTSSGMRIMCWIYKR